METLASDITPNEIKEMAKFLKEHPIDPAYDEEMKLMDGDVPDDQFMARLCRSILDNLTQEERDSITENPSEEGQSPKE